MPKATQRISLDEHRAVMAAAVRTATRSDVACDALANPKVSTAWFALPVPPKRDLVRDVDAYVKIARCAEAQQFYKLVKDIGYYLVEAGTNRYEIEARGLIGLGDHKTAIGVLEAGLERAPKDPNLLVTAAKVSCALDRWPQCAKLGAQALKQAAAMPASERAGVGGRALKYLARASLHLGDLADARRFATEAEKLGADRADMTEIRSLLTQAEIHKALVEPTVDTNIPLGLYHLYGKLGTLLDVQVTNLGDGSAQYKIEASIDGVTQRAVQTLALGKGEAKRLTMSPALASAFDIARVRSAQPAQLVLKVSATTGAGTRVVYEQTHGITLQPRDFLPTVQRIGADASTTTLWAVGAWITPNTKSIDGFLQKAKSRAPRAAFSGEQSATFDQVKAIYEELQARGMSYVMDPYLFENGPLHGQRTRLPHDVLSSTNAQCLEGTILYAALFEAIGIKPVVVLVPGHAFVGWHASPKDKAGSRFFFLETTATHDASFEDAVRIGTDEFAEHDQAKKAKVIDVTKLRKAGVSPQPVE